MCGGGTGRQHEKRETTGDKAGDKNPERKRQRSKDRDGQRAPERTGWEAGVMNTETGVVVDQTQKETATRLFWESRSSHTSQVFVGEDMVP